MPRKGENIRKRKDGRWEARYEKCRDQNGRIQYGYLYGRTYEAVKKKKLAILYQNNLQNSPGKCYVFRNLSEEWMLSMRYAVKLSTYACYGALIIALELILQKNSIFGFLFGNGLSSLVGNFVTNRRTITDLNFYVIDNQYITSWYDSGFVFLILCVFICVHFIIELTKIIVDKHIEISLRKKSLVLLIGMILVMFYSFIIDVLTWYQPIFIISFIIALSNWNIKEAKKECEYTR